jgi:hypothetical protein
MIYTADSDKYSCQLSIQLTVIDIADSDRYICRSGLLSLFITDFCSIVSLLCSVL